MKYYVRVCSAIAFLFLLFVNLSAIGGLGKNISYLVYELNHPVKINGTLDGEATPFLNAAAEASQARILRIKIAVLIVAILLLLVENVWRFYLANKLRQINGITAPMRMCGGCKV